MSGFALPRHVMGLLAVLAASLAVMLTAYQEEIGSAIRTWNRSSAYGHCWLVLPITFWLLWERRDALGAIAPRPALWPVLLAPLLAAAWIAADWLGIMEGRQFALIGFIELLFLAAFGWNLWRALSPGLLYLVFLVPSGAFITPALQHFTAGFIVDGLSFLNIPYEADAMRITIPEGAFYVAEACAGLRFLIASVAFGVLFALTMFRSPWRRAIFIAVSCVVPILANGLRGLGIVVLGHVLGSAEAATADHLIYGWVFFSSVILLLALAGFAFRQVPRPAFAPQPGLQAPNLARLVLVCAPMVLAGVATPALSGAMDRPGAIPQAAQDLKVTLPAGCRVNGRSAAGAAITQKYLCGGQPVDMIATSLAPGSNPARILDAGRNSAISAIGGDVDAEPWYNPATGAAWIILEAHDTGRAAGYTVLQDGRQMTGSLRDRLAMARGVFHPGAAPICIAVRVDAGELAAGTLLRDFLAAQTAIIAAK